MLFFMAPIFAVLFIGYFLYRLFVTKDLKKHKGEMFAGLIFAGIWVILLGVLAQL